MLELLKIRAHPNKNMQGCHTSSPAAFHLPPLDRVPRYMDAAADQWHQELGLVKSMEMVSFSAATTTTTTTTSATNTCSTAAARPQVTEKRGRPQKEQALNCPRCNSTNTKFCYYNNYSLTQPRYFCKACRRYWTEGGSLRNVPVGGGSRKNKRLSLSSSSSSITTTTTPVTSTAVSSLKNNPSITELNLPLISFSTPHHDLNPSGLPEFSEFTNLEDNSNGASVRGIRAFAPLSLPEFPAGFELQELRAPAHDFPMQGSRGQYARVLFPFEDMKPAAVHSSANEADFDNSRGQSGHPPAALWNGMIGGGGTW